MMGFWEREERVRGFEGKLKRENGKEVFLL